MLKQDSRGITRTALLVAAGILFAAAPAFVAAQAPKPAAQAAASPVPKGKQTTLGLYVTAAKAYEMWKANPDKVKLIDVRTPEEYAFVGHPEKAWNVPVAFVSYERKGGKFDYEAKPNPGFVAQVKEIAKPGDTLLVMCRSGGGERGPSTCSPPPGSRSRTTWSTAWKGTWWTIPRAPTTASAR